MPFKPHVRVTALGRLGNGTERFQYGVNLAPTTQEPIGLEWAPDKDWILDVAADLVAFHGRAASRISSSAVLDTVKVAEIGADGSYAREAVTVDVADTPGGVDTQMLEVTVDGATYRYDFPQTALAVSLVTAGRGPSRRGRFYLPMPVVPVRTSDFAAPVSMIEGIRGSVVTLIDALNNSPGFDTSDINVVIASSKNYNTPVTGVRVGRVVDTIRTRRAQLPELYTATAAVA